MAERGLLFSMMAACWVNGSVPSDPSLLARAIGSTEAEVRPALTERVLGQFQDCHTRPGFLEHPDLVRQRREMEHRGRLKSEGGKEGAKKRWAKATLTASDPMADGMGNPLGEPLADPMGAEMSRDEMSRGVARREEPAYKDERVKSPEDEFIREYDEEERRISSGMPPAAPRPSVTLVTTGRRVRHRP